MKDPVDHILRPRLPWRADAGITECGLNASKAPTLTRDQFFQRLKDMGRQRTAMLTCITCSDTASRWGTWDDDPRTALAREIQWETGLGGYRHRDRGTSLLNELIALEALFKAHREEFEAHLETAEQRRAWNEKKAANQAAKINAISTHKL